jgi:hemolysin D
METPPHPASLWVARSLFCTLVAVILVAAFGQLDIVAVANGQLIPSASVKVIQPAVTGVVRQIWVKNGDRVAAGQTLIDLDPTQSGADVDKARAGRLDAMLTIARAQSLLDAQRANRPPHVANVEGAPRDRADDTQNYAEGAFGEYQLKLASMRAELHRREAALGTLNAEIEKLRRISPLAEQQAKDYENLAAKNYVSAHALLDHQRIAIDQKEELAAEQSRAREMEASIDTQRRDIEETTATFRRQQLEFINQAGLVLSQSRGDETKASSRNALMQIKSPVSGIVQQLSIHSTGAVVSTAQPIMEIVPDEKLEVEARISNRDIGFVQPGQRARIKVTTFPYTRYGYLDGQVIKVSNDATFDRKMGSVFLARLAIPSNRFVVNGKTLNLSPGMEVTTEIKTGKQKVWQYFLSPLIQVGNESLHER